MNNQESKVKVNKIVSPCCGQQMWKLGDEIVCEKCKRKIKEVIEYVLVDPNPLN